MSNCTLVIIIIQFIKRTTICFMFPCLDVMIPKLQHLTRIMSICHLGIKVNITQRNKHDNTLDIKKIFGKGGELAEEQYAVSLSTDATIRAASTSKHASLSLSLPLLVHVFLSIHQSNFVYERREFKWLNKQKKEKNPYEQESLSAYLIMPS